MKIFRNLYHQLRGHVCVSIYGEDVDVFERWAISVNILEPDRLTIYWSDGKESIYEINRIKNLLISN